MKTNLQLRKEVEEIKDNTQTLDANIVRIENAFDLMEEDVGNNINFDELLDLKF